MGRRKGLEFQRNIFEHTFPNSEVVMMVPFQILLMPSLRVLIIAQRDAA